MTKLKLSDLTEDKPVRVTIYLPASVHRDLLAYAAVLTDKVGKGAPSPEKLIAPMIVRFMATDRAFAKARRAIQAEPATG
jgi:hypothetical protein